MLSPVPLWKNDKLCVIVERMKSEDPMEGGYTMKKIFLYRAILTLARHSIFGLYSSLVLERNSQDSSKHRWRNG